MGKIKGMIIRLKREPDPVLTIDELVFISLRLTESIGDYDEAMGKGPVSESILRARITAIDADNKIRQVLMSYGRSGPSHFDSEETLWQNRSRSTR